MKQTIRYNTFETNSSAMHSLVVVKNPKPYTKHELRLRHYKPDPDSHRIDRFELFSWEEPSFGRSPYQVLREPLDKLRYYVAHEIGNCEKYELIDSIKELISKYTDVDVKNIKISKDEKYKNPGYGYIEHNDSGESPFDYIRRKNINVEDFIFNPKYVVIVDGDEYCEFLKLFESNILDANNFEDISSGPDFWNRPSHSIYLNWFRDYRKESPVTDEDIDEAVDGISDFITTVVVYVTKYLMENTYDPELMKKIKAKALELSPNSKFVISNENWSSEEEQLSEKDFKKYDTSMFDEVIVKVEQTGEYDD